MPGQSRGTLFDEDFLVRLQQLQLLAKSTTGGLSTGKQRSRQLGDGLEFADHRAYAPGDDIRFVDWPYYARMEKLLLRLFHQHSEADVVVLLDCSASMTPGGDQDKFTYALKAAAALAYVAMASLDRVTLQPFADELREAMNTGRSTAQILQALDFLAGLAASGRTDLGGCTERFARRNRAPATVFIISDLMGCSQDLSGALAHLKRRSCDVTVLHVYSPQEADPDLTGPLLLNCVESGVVMPVEATEAVLESYRRKWSEFRAGCERTCGSRAVGYIAAPTNRPFDRLILQTLRQAGVLSG